MRNRPDALIRPISYNTTAFVYSFNEQTEIKPAYSAGFFVNPAIQFAGGPCGP